MVENLITNIKRSHQINWSQISFKILKNKRFSINIFCHINLYFFKDGSLLICFYPKKSLIKIRSASSIILSRNTGTTIVWSRSWKKCFKFCKSFACRDKAVRWMCFENKGLLYISLWIKYVNFKFKWNIRRNKHFLRFLFTKLQFWVHISGLKKTSQNVNITERKHHRTWKTTTNRTIEWWLRLPN